LPYATASRLTPTGGLRKAARLAVLHYDHDFGTIAEITHQPVEWIVPAGSVD